MGLSKTKGTTLELAGRWNFQEQPQLFFSYVETLIPIHLGIPGVKLGLANLIIVLALYKMGIKEAYILV